MNLFIGVLIGLAMFSSSEDTKYPAYPGPMPQAITVPDTTEIQEAEPIVLREGMRRFSMTVWVEDGDLDDLKAGDNVSLFAFVFLDTPDYDQAERFRDTYMTRHIPVDMRLLSIDLQESSLEDPALVEVLIMGEVDPSAIMLLVQLQSYRFPPVFSVTRDIPFSEENLGVYGNETYYVEKKQAPLPQSVSQMRPLIIKKEGAGLPEFCDSCTTISSDTFFERADLESTACSYLPSADGSRWSAFPCPEAEE
ncbi:MAG: hypothetical protein JKY31_09905 [Rhodobacteraceae bacterium]|nr:hypothetical protein [Paracoccaceae bacterium]